jgi:hypothetical protein
MHRAPLQTHWALRRTSQPPNHKMIYVRLQTQPKWLSRGGVASRLSLATLRNKLERSNLVGRAR